MADHTTFTNIVQASEPLSARWSELAQRAIADARGQGVTLEPEDVLNLREVRNATLGAELDEEAYQRELLALPAMSDVATRRAIEEGNEEARSAALSDLYRGRDKVRPEHRGADSAARLSRARELGLATPPAAAEDRDEKLRMLKDVGDHQTRLRLARKWGLV